MNDKNLGWYRKYIVSRTDGRSAEGEKHWGCEYFVIDLNHDPYAQAAMMAYARACAVEYPLLAEDIRRRFENVAVKPPAPEQEQVTK